MNFRPLCTASVWPTNSGITVKRRDQVLTTFFSFTRFISSIFSRSGVSTNGPFFSERLIVFYPGTSDANDRSPIANLAIVRLLLSPLQDELVGRLPVARLV